MLTTGHCLLRHLPGQPMVAACRHGRLLMPGRTREEGAHKDLGQEQRIIAAAQAWATLTVTDTHRPARGRPMPRPLCPNAAMPPAMPGMPVPVRAVPQRSAAGVRARALCQVRLDG
jgi:hypothetical protein